MVTYRGNAQDEFLFLRRIPGSMVQRLLLESPAKRQTEKGVDKTSGIRSTHNAGTTGSDTKPIRKRTRDRTRMSWRRSWPGRSNRHGSWRGWSPSYKWLAWVAVGVWRGSYVSCSSTPYSGTRPSWERSSIFSCKSVYVAAV